jgi:cyclase
VKRLKEGAIAAAGLLATAAVVWAQQQDFTKVKIEPVKVAPGVTLLSGAGGNIGVFAGDDGVLVIDSQYAALSEKIQAALKALSDKPVRFLLNTHWHPDHTGGNEWLAKAGATVIAQDTVRKRLAAGQFQEVFKRQVPAAPAQALPVVTFDDEVEVHWNGDDLHAVHVPPAHTDGDVFIHFQKANVIHAGDLFFSAGFPLVDESSGGDFQGYITGAEKMLALCNDKTKVIPGHGVLSDTQGLKAWHEMMTRVRDRVKASAAAGKTLAQIQAEHPTKEWDTTYGKGFVKPEMLVEWVFKSVTRKAP